MHRRSYSFDPSSHACEPDYRSDESGLGPHQAAEVSRSQCLKGHQTLAGTLATSHQNEMFLSSVICHPQITLRDEIHAWVVILSRDS